ncbi:(deoxy)nucleoside triphosphate pyrophosphohydrolase [Novosphingobium sp. AP12]|uniref:(deoxy)nucleoside triphosphate pyrophosphohydrolase n=1 Tax=Novosphingobium sp. AP12 TaxID=1144305 RepID=UPI0002721EBA|nr:(deoxy)nucleoside triphosphate pyrophosphohydrolase [Novosphingobium sp. AP12]EJL32202.1 ADP-ribose pyrophosphatase [Novosphingobium sp. AP12]
MLVVAAALIDRTGGVLMQQRRFGGVHGGLWEFPGGKVEPGEDPEDAVVRELAEELGITLSREFLEPVGFASGRTAPPEHGGKGPARPLVILLYACREWRGTASALEAAAIDWLRPEAIEDLAMPPLDYPLARAICRYLSGPESKFLSKEAI